MTDNDKNDGLRLTEEQIKHRKQRNYAIAGSLIALVLIFFFLTIFKLGPEIVANRPL